MTTTEFRAGLAVIGTNQTGAGKIFGVTPRTIRRLVAGPADVTGPIERLVLACVRDPRLADFLRNLPADRK